MSEVLRVEPAALRLPLVERVAMAVLDRALVRLDGGTLEVTLPGGAVRSFGTGPAVPMQIHDHRIFRRIATRGDIGLGESYTAGEWDADLVPFFELLLRNSQAAVDRHTFWRRMYDSRPRPNRRTGLLKARRHISYHYDLGNDFFALMLDPTMTYSCAVFESDDETLEDAQRRKYRKICEQLALGADDRVLEIGCGWGGFAHFAAEKYGCRVTGLTISREQASYARARIEAAGLDDRVEILGQDYRRHDGSYTKVASIEMLEAIGEKQFPTYFRAIDRLLEQGGKACVQTIVVPDERWDRYRRSPDWIERYVFPGCLIPSLGALAHATAKTRLEIGELREIGPNYAETLRRWRVEYRNNIREVRELGFGPRFERTWDFYLSFCEAAFRTHALRDIQLTLWRSLEGCR